MAAADASTKSRRRKNTFAMKFVNTENTATKPKKRRQNSTLNGTVAGRRRTPGTIPIGMSGGPTAIGTAITIGTVIATTVITTADFTREEARSCWTKVSLANFHER